MKKILMKIITIRKLRRGEASLLILLLSINNFLYVNGAL